MRKRTVAISAVIAYFGQVIGILQGLILIPLCISRLGTEVYGYWLGLYGIVSLLSISDMGLSQPTQARIAGASGAGRRADVSGFIWAGAVVFGTIALSLGTATALLAGRAVAWLGAPQASYQALTTAFTVASGAVVLHMVNDFLRGTAVSLLRPIPLLTAFVAAQTLGLGLSILLLLNGAGVVSIPTGLVLSEVVVLLASGLFYFREQRRTGLLAWPPTRAHFHGMLSLAPYTLLSQAGTRMIRQADVSLITLALGPASTVVYVASRKISDLMGRLVSVLWGGMLLPLAHLAGEKSVAHGGQTQNQILQALVSLVILLAGCYVAMNTTIMRAWLGDRIAPPLLLVVLIALARITDNLYNICSETHVAMGNIKLYALGNAAMAAVTFLLYVLLVRTAGLPGMPIAFAISAFGFAVFFMYQGARRYGIPTPPPSQLARLTIAAAASLALGTAAAMLAAPLPAAGRWSVGIAATLLLTLGWFALFWPCFVALGLPRLSTFRRRRNAAG